MTLIPPNEDEPPVLPPFFDREPQRWDPETGHNTGGGPLFPDPDEQPQGG